MKDKKQTLHTFIQSDKQNEEPEAFTFNISQRIRRKQKLPQSH